jgi:O-antigen/teichoic acid export membrane protein
VALNLACAAALVLFGRTLIRVWAGPAAVPTNYLLLAMAAWAVISGFMSVESCLLAALNRTREQAILSIVAAVVNIALSIALVRHMGSVGVIGGTILSYLLVLVIPQCVIVSRLLSSGLKAERGRSSPFACRGNKEGGWPLF